MRKLSCLLWILLFSISYLSTKAQSNTANTDSFKDQFLKIINQARRTGCTCGTSIMKPAEPLTWNEQLAAAAEVHAKDMSKRNYFNHVSASGKSVMDRIISAGYTPEGYQRYIIGENIAKGQPSIEKVMKSWFKSDHHCLNLMNPAYKEIGIAESNLYWVQDFGGREPFLNAIKSSERP